MNSPLDKDSSGIHSSASSTVDKSYLIQNSDVAISHWGINDDRQKPTANTATSFKNLFRAGSTEIRPVFGVSTRPFKKPKVIIRRRSSGDLCSLRTTLHNPPLSCSIANCTGIFLCGRHRENYQEGKRINFQPLSRRKQIRVTRSKASNPYYTTRSSIGRRANVGTKATKRKHRQKLVPTHLLRLYLRSHIVNHHLCRSDTLGNLLSFKLAEPAKQCHLSTNNLGRIQVIAPHPIRQPVAAHMAGRPSHAAPGLSNA